MTKDIRIVAGAHSYGLTLQLSEDVTVYVGLPTPAGCTDMSTEEVDRTTRRAADRQLSP